MLNNIYNMNYLRTYEHFMSNNLVLEYVTNMKYSNKLRNEMFAEIQKLDSDSKVLLFDEHEMAFFKIRFNPKYEIGIKRIMSKYNSKANKMDMHLYYEIEEDAYYDEELSILKGLLKKAKLKRVKPTKYIYHITAAKNVKSILKDGLIISKMDIDKWEYNYSYPDAIFASTEDDEGFKLNNNSSVTLKIDTTNLPNKWWVDLNFYVPHMNWHQRGFIMTFENIPPEYITIADK